MTLPLYAKPANWLCYFEPEVMLLELAIPNKETVPIRLFPITVPIMTFRYENLFRPLPEEEFTFEEAVTENYTMNLSITAVRQLCQSMQAQRWAKLSWYQLALLAQELDLLTDDTELLVLANLQDRWRRAGVIAFPHQLVTAKRVITHMDGRAILADEVGLGKTIEACMIIKEYMLRGMARRVLILTPASLCWQWYQEMKDKFGILATLQRSEYDWERCDVLIASVDTAKRQPHCDIIRNLSYDILVVDEAHKLKNANTANWQLVNSLSKKYFLMLTATPLQNDLKELFNLITLLKPGQLGTYTQFLDRYVYDKRLPRDAPALRRLLDEVMIRNRRGKDTVEFTARQVSTVQVELTPEERKLYQDIGELRLHLSDSCEWSLPNALCLLTLERETCSSPLATAFTLQNMINKGTNAPLEEHLQQLLQTALACPICSKAERLVELVNEIGEKVIVFTEYRTTQQYLRWRLEQEGLMALGFDGSLSANRKEWVRELFRRQGDVLVSTESGGEGLNFQFASHVVNYDLPWNPMRIEQRIGRVHRLGQTRDVHIYNMSTAGTIEEYILYLLHEKINMFNLVMGELDAILAQLGDGKGFEKQLYQILADSDTDPALVRQRLDELAESFSSAQQQVQEQRTKIDRWLSIR